MKHTRDPLTLMYMTAHFPRMERAPKKNWWLSIYTLKHVYARA
jgi:hypothetical protein